MGEGTSLLLKSKESVLSKEGREHFAGVGYSYLFTEQNLKHACLEILFLGKG